MATLTHLNLGKDAAVIERVAQERQDWNNRHGAVSKIVEGGDLPSNLCGMKGEWAVGRFLHLPLPESIINDGDRGYDFKIGKPPRELTIEAKYAKWPRGELFVNVDNGYEVKADVVFLVTTAGPGPDQPKVGEFGSTQVIVRGWLTKKKFFELRTERDYGYRDRGRCLGVTQAQIWSPSIWDGFLDYLGVEVEEEACASSQRSLFV